MATVGFVAWIGVATLLLDRIATTDTRAFVRDGLVRWSLAAVLFAVTVRAVPAWPMSTLGRPRLMVRFPWATILMVLGAGLLGMRVVQFWSDRAYTAAVVFSEFGTGFVEEVGFRGLVFCGLVAGFGSDRRGMRRAAYLSCGLFGLAHAFAGPVAIIVTALLGALFLASTLELSSLWPAAVMHGVLDVGVYGTEFAPMALADDWGEPWIGVGDMAAFGGSVAALVAFAAWRRWPGSDLAPNTEMNSAAVQTG